MNIKDMNKKQLLALLTSTLSVASFGRPLTTKEMRENTIRINALEIEKIVVKKVSDGGPGIGSTEGTGVGTGNNSNLLGEDSDTGGMGGEDGTGDNGYNTGNGGLGSGDGNSDGNGNGTGTGNCGIDNNNNNNNGLGSKWIIPQNANNNGYNYNGAYDNNNGAYNNNNSISTTKDPNANTWATTSSDLSFEFDKIEINPKYNQYLIDVINEVNRRNSRLKIVGHTDSVGKAAYNQKLSERRAEAAKKRLISLGLDPRKIVSVEGKGSREPIASNATKVGRAKNRRIDFTFVY